MRRVISAALAMVMVMAISIPAFAIDKEREVSRLAYMNLDQASEAMQEKILQAREEIIFSKSWVADGLQGFVYDKDGNVIEEVPQFSEIFPADWDMPTFDVQEDIEVENNGYLQDENSVTPLINSDDVMVTVFSDTLKLRVPSNSDTPAFDTFDTTYWYNYYHYNMTYAFVRTMPLLWQLHRARLPQRPLPRRKWPCRSVLPAWYWMQQKLPHPVRYEYYCS